MPTTEGQPFSDRELRRVEAALQARVSAWTIDDRDRRELRTVYASVVLTLLADLRERIGSDLEHFRDDAWESVVRDTAWHCQLRVSLVPLLAPEGHPS